MDAHLITHNEEAERAVLGSILLRHEVKGSYRDKPFMLLEAQDFYDSQHAMIFSVSKELWEQGNPTDPIAVGEMLGESLQEMGGYSFLTELGTYGDIDPTHNCQIILKKSRSRQIYYATLKVDQTLRDGGDLEDIRRILDEVDGEEKTENFSEAVRATLERIETNKKSGLEVGFPDLDRLSGGIEQSDMIVLAGRPSSGKTSLALQIARYVGRNRNVAIASVETTTSQLLERILFQEAVVDYHKYRSRKLSSDDLANLKNASREVESLKIHINHKVQKIGDILAWARQEKPDLLIVDYLQLISGSQGRSDYERISELSLRLKSLAKIIECPVLVLSQLSRNPEARPGHEPILSDLRGSGKIEEDADQIWMLHRPELYKGKDTFTDGSPTKNVTQLFVRKNRNGPTGEIKLYFDKGPMCFRNYAAESSYIEL